MLKQENYVLKNYPYAKAAGELFKMDPFIILSQGANESGWGTSGISTKYNNYFGILAAGKSNSYWTGKKILGNKKYNLYFRVYDNPQQSFNDFARLISSSYKSAFAVNHNYKEYAHQISISPYISEKNGDRRPLYKAAIISIYEDIMEIAKKKELLKQPD
jgi:flagellar protein FlgJ